MVQLSQNACHSCNPELTSAFTHSSNWSGFTCSLAQNLLNELLFQLSLFTAQIFASARTTSIAMTVRSVHVLILRVYTCALRSITVGTWPPWADVLNYSTFDIFCPLYHYIFIWAYVALLHALSLPARSYALLCEACSIMICTNFSTSVSLA